MSLILNVDDNDAQRYAKSRALLRAGYSILEAATGVEAMRLFNERKPDLVLLDVNQPDANGIQLYREMKARARDVIVANISASQIGQNDRVQGLDEGADAYLIESMASEELL